METKSCEFKAKIGESGQLVVEATSDECHAAALKAANDVGVTILRPKQVTG